MSAAALPQPTSADDSLKRYLYISAALHVAVLLFLYFGMPHFAAPLPSPHMPVPFEIVEIADMTNTRVKTPEEAQKPPAPAPAPQPKAAPAPPTPPQPKEEQVEALLPKPSEKPKPPQDAKPKPDMLASVLRDVSKLKPADQPKTPDAKSTTKDQAAPDKSVAPALSDRLTISEEDALRRQVEQCWNPPIGARDAEKLVVEVTIIMNTDRTVQSAEVVDKIRMASDPYFRAAGEAALRALYNPKCSPLLLPADKYEQWKTIDFTFDPRDML